MVGIIASIILVELGLAFTIIRLAWLVEKELKKRDEHIYGLIYDINNLYQAIDHMRNDIPRGNDYEH